MDEDNFNLLSEAENIFNSCLQLLKRKNKDYSGGEEDSLKNFITTAKLLNLPVEKAILVRLSDKYMRLISLIDKQPSVVEEPLEDTIKDLINYSAILLAYMNYKTKPKEIKAKKIEVKIPTTGKRRKKWTKEEIEFLINNYGKLSPSEIAKKLGRSWKSVIDRAYILRKKGIITTKLTGHWEKKKKGKPKLPINEILSDVDYLITYEINKYNTEIAKIVKKIKKRKTKYPKSGLLKILLLYDKIKSKYNITLYQFCRILYENNYLPKLGFEEIPKSPDNLYDFVDYLRRSYLLQTTNFHHFLKFEKKEKEEITAEEKKEEKINIIYEIIEALEKGKTIAQVMKDVNEKLKNINQKIQVRTILTVQSHHRVMRNWKQQLLKLLNEGKTPRQIQKWIMENKGVNIPLEIIEGELKYLAEYYKR